MKDDGTVLFFSFKTNIYVYTIFCCRQQFFTALIHPHVFYSMVFLSLIFVFIKFIIVCWVYSFSYLTFFLSRIFHDLCIGLYVVCLNSVYLFHTFAFTYSVFITLFTYIKSFFFFWFSDVALLAWCLCQEYVPIQPCGV